MKSRLLGGPPVCSPAGHGHSVLSKLHAGSSEWKQSSTDGFWKRTVGRWQGICSWSGWNGWRSHNTILWNGLEKKTSKGLLQAEALWGLAKVLQAIWKVERVELVKSWFEFLKKKSNWQRLWWIVFFRRKVLTCSSCVNAPRHLKGWVTGWPLGGSTCDALPLVVVRWSQSCAVEKWMVAFTCCIAIQGQGTSWQRGVSNCWMLRQLRLTKVCLCKSRRCECLFVTFQAILAASLAWGRGALF